MSELDDQRPAAMDGFFAVFNSHLSDANRRAREILAPDELAELERIEAGERSSNGISWNREPGTMGIFRVPPTPATLRYVDLVKSFVNENRRPKEDASPPPFTGGAG